MKKSLALFTATGLFIGYFPFVPGTMGTILGVVIYWAFSGHLLLSLLLTLLLSLWSIKQTSYLLKEDDSRIVIDEITGFLAAMLFLPSNWGYIMAAFIIFRTIDILKPPPIKRLEKIPSPWGVVLDDLTAGAFTCLLLHSWRWIR